MTEAGQPLIQISDMTKVFYTDEIETHALSGVHLSVSKGEYVAMSGPSGCGKSTLLSIIGLLDTPTTGRYMLNAKPVENLDFAERARIRNQEIGFIFQSFNLIGDLPPGARPDLSVDGTIDLERLDNVLYVGRPAFGQENSTISLFKLDRDGHDAVRVPVKVGRASVNSIQVVDGLREGDTVVLSDMSRWDNTDRIRLQD